MTHILELTQPLTARRVLEAVREDGLEDDAYHELLAIGAHAMEREGLCHWIYVTGWPTMTLWRSPTARNSTLVVRLDGTVS